ncbi:hypothetical protein [Streptomyces sp. NPDC127103]|uniref:hypothetical protein n=1 Tax=Streptomyces sp. NPDC127103 TaxID=3347139 RepID=UPI00366870A2
MNNHEEAPTIEERAALANSLMGMFVQSATAVGSELGMSERAELGRALAEHYAAGEGVSPATEFVLGELVADLYHSADGVVSPYAMLGAALMEVSATVNTVPLLCSLGDDGRAGILACALAAILAYCEQVGVCPDVVTDAAHHHWSEEVEEARFMKIRAERFDRS